MAETAVAALVATMSLGWVETTYLFDNEDGPVVTDSEGRRVRVTKAVITEFGNGVEPAVGVDGKILTGSGAIDRRFSGSAPAYGSGIEEALVAAHAQKRRSALAEEAMP